MNPKKLIETLQQSLAIRFRQKPRCLQRFFTAVLALGAVLLLLPARADNIVLLDNFDNVTNDLSVNDLGIGGGFSHFVRNNENGAYESGGYAVITTLTAGFNQSCINSINSFSINAGGTAYEVNGVKFALDTSNTGAGTGDVLLWGVSNTNSAANWYANTTAGLPVGYWVQIMSDSVPTGAGSGGWTGTSTLFYKNAAGTSVQLASWVFDNLKWSKSGPNNFSPVLGMKITLSATGWALNITGDTYNSGQPINFSGTYAGSGITNELNNGLNGVYLGAFTTADPPAITMSIDQAKVTQLGALVVTTPQFSTPLYGFNTSTVLAGETVTLISSVTDSAGTPTLQWQMESSPNSGNFVNLPSGNATSVVVNTSALGDGLPRGIRLLANDGFGNSIVSAVVTLTVNAAQAPVVSQDITPAFLSLYTNQGGVFSASFTGNKPIFYNWQYSPLSAGTFTNIPNATNVDYLIASAKDSDQGDYRLVASNSVSTAMSAVGSVYIFDSVPVLLFSAPYKMGGLNANQILTNFPSANKIAGAMYATNGGLPLVVTTGNGNISFGASGVGAASVTGGTGFGTGASTNQTGNANFNTCLNDFFSGTNTTLITLNGLVSGQQYQVQLFALDDRSGNGARVSNYQNPSDSYDVSANFKMGDNSYLLATFTANGTSQTIQQNMLNTNGNFNALVLRTVGWNPPPYFAYQPQNQGNFVSFNATITGVAAGDSTIPSPTITYKWQSGSKGGPYSDINDSTKYSGTTTTSLTISNLASTDGNPVYVLKAQNGGGTVISREVTLNVQSAPHSINAGSYAAAAVANNPVGLWMLDEVDNPTNGTLQAFDYTLHGNYGKYGTAAQNLFNGILSPQPTDVPPYPGFYAGEGALKTTGGNANSLVSLPSLNLTNLSVAGGRTNFATTIALWFKPTDNGNYARGLFFARNTGNGTGNGGNQIAGLGYSAGNGTLGYNYNDNGGTYNFNSGLTPVQNIWNFAALVIETNQATFYLYYLDTNGLPIVKTVVNPVANAQLVSMSGGLINIGTDQYDVPGRAFNGSIAGAALYNSALSANQVLTMFNAGAGISSVLPNITIQPPANTKAYINSTATISVLGIGGTTPITNRWQFNNTDLVDGSFNGAIITGSTSNVLTISGVNSLNNGSYHLVLSNQKGVTISSNSVLTTFTAPPQKLLGAWFTGTATLADVSGNSPAGVHDAYGVNGANVAASNYAFTNDVPPNYTGQSLWLKGNTAMAITNSATVDAGYDGLFDAGISNSFTIMTWAKGTPGTWAPWVSKYGETTPTPAGGWQLRRNNNGGAVMTMRGTGATDDPTGNIGFNSGWHLYTGTYDAVSGMRILYVDGVVSLALPGNGSYTLASGEHLTIGGRDAPTNTFSATFTGQIYGVRIYSYALTQSQIQAIYNPVPQAPAFTGKPVLIPGGPNGKQMVLQWSVGTLLQATNLVGPWTLTGATSPYTNDLTSPQKYFKLSNP